MRQSASGPCFTLPPPIEARSLISTAHEQQELCLITVPSPELSTAASPSPTLSHPRHSYAYCRVTLDFNSVSILVNQLPGAFGLYCFYGLTVAFL